MLKPGDCLLFETNYDRLGLIKKHLFIIVLEPQGATRLTIIVNIATLESKKQDQTTILEPGDHDFIDRRSYVYYRYARIKSYDDLEKLIKSGEAKQYPTLRDDILQRVCDGLLKSPFTPIEVAELYQDYLYSKM